MLATTFLIRSSRGAQPHDGAASCVLLFLLANLNEYEYIQRYFLQPLAGLAWLFLILKVYF